MGPCSVRAAEKGNSACLDAGSNQLHFLCAMLVQTRLLFYLLLCGHFRNKDLGLDTNHETDLICCRTLSSDLYRTPRLRTSGPRPCTRTGASWGPKITMYGIACVYSDHGYTLHCSSMSNGCAPLNSLKLSTGRVSGAICTYTLEVRWEVSVY